jgi:hypothetical protein
VRFFLWGVVLAAYLLMARPNLAAQGGAPMAIVTPPSITFPPLAAGSMSDTRMVTVMNSGTTALHIKDITIRGTNLPGFLYVSSCALPVDPGDSCNINVSFYPSTVESRTAQLVITDDAPNSPQTVALSGSATMPYTAALAGATTATVPSGGSAEYTLTLSPSGAFIGSVQVACSGLPSGASCSPMPATVALSSRDVDDDMVKVTVMTAGVAGTKPTPPGTYMFYITANWGLLSVKLPVTLVVQ